MAGKGSASQPSGPRPLRPEPLLAVLAAHGVEYIVVGGYAVAAHGFARATKDVDICPDPGKENLGRLGQALAELEAVPIELDEFEGGFDPEPDFDGLRMDGNWTLMTKHGRLDVMQRFSFDETADGEGSHRDLASRAVDRTFLGHRVRFCGYEDLLRMKRAANRAQDRVDIETLKAARGEL
jgi:hypothetical protein